MPGVTEKCCRVWERNGSLYTWERKNIISRWDFRPSYTRRAESEAYGFEKACLCQLRGSSGMPAFLHPHARSRAQPCQQRALSTLRGAPRLRLPLWPPLQWNTLTSGENTLCAIPGTKNSHFQRRRIFRIAFEVSTS